MTSSADYDALRHFADSYGLIFMGVCWLGFVLWAFRPSARSLHHDAAHMIFDEDRNSKDQDNGGQE